MAKTRETRIPEQALGDLEDFMGEDDIVFPVDDVDQLEEAIRAATVITRFIGGSVVITALREEVAPGVFLPREYVWRYNSFMPAIKAAQEAEAEGEPEPEPAAAA